MKRFQRGFGLALLVKTENRVENNDEQDGDRIAEAREQTLPGPRRETDDRCDHRRREQRQDKGIGELHQKPDQRALFLALRQSVRAVLGKPFCGFFLAQPFARIEAYML